MTKLLALCVAALLTMAASTARADDATTADAVKAVFNALNDAFARNDSDAVKLKMTADHVAVTAYYGAPLSVAEQIASLPDFANFNETPLSKVTVTPLGSDAAAITFTAKDEGTFKGQPLPSPVYVTALYVRHNGQWLEKFYQTTVLKP